MSKTAFHGNGLGGREPREFESGRRQRGKRAGRAMTVTRIAVALVALLCAGTLLRAQSQAGNESGLVLHNPDGTTRELRSTGWLTTRALRPEWLRFFIFLDGEGCKPGILRDVKLPNLSLVGDLNPGGSGVARKWDVGRLEDDERIWLEWPSDEGSLTDSTGTFSPQLEGDSLTGPIDLTSTDGHRITGSIKVTVCGETSMSIAEGSLPR